MPTTSIQALPYPAAVGVTPDVPFFMKTLAEAVEKGMVMRFASIAERDAKLPSGQRVAGMIAWVDSDQTYYVWSTTGTPSWRVMWVDSGWIQLATSPIIFIRRIGGTVTLVTTGGTLVPSLGRIPISTPNIVPASLRPAHDVLGVAELRWLQNGIGTITVDAGGTVWLWNPTPSANASWYGSITYVV